MVRSARHSQNREVGSAILNPTVLCVGVHHHAGHGLYDVGEVIPRIGNFGDLLLTHCRRDVAILCLEERRFASDRNLAARLRDFQRDVQRSWRPQQYIHCSAVFAKTLVRNSQRVSAGARKKNRYTPSRSVFVDSTLPLDVLDFDVCFVMTALL